MAGEPTDHVIVGELPPELDEESLKTNFEAYGNVKWLRLWPGKNGGNGSAIIEFGSVEEATWLVENVNGNVPLGMTSAVSVKYKPPAGAAKSKGGGKERPSPYGMGAGGGGKGGQGKGFGGGKGGFGPPTDDPTSVQDLFKALTQMKILPGGTWANDENTVCVSGLPVDTTDFDLLKIFTPFGAIAPGGVRVKLNEDGTAKGTGMINFLDGQGAGTAVAALNNTTMPDGRCLRLRLFDANSFGGKGNGKGKGKGKAQLAAQLAQVAQSVEEGGEGAA